MKSQKGITLVSLVVYVIVMLIVLSTIGVIINQFYKNTDTIEADTEEILEFNKFNTYFLKEVKRKENKVDTINTDYISFASGNSFSFKNNKIYYNSMQICKNVEELIIEQGQDGDGQKDIVCVTLKFENFEKKINYKVEEIY